MSKAARAYSEAELKVEIETRFVPKLAPGDSVLLSGDLGAGKSTFARLILECLGIEKGGEGSPTFPILREYRSSQFPKILHLDLYRLESERDPLEALEMTGAFERMEEATLTLVEWPEVVPELGESIRKRAKNSGARVHSIRLSLDDDPIRRQIFF